MNRVSGHRLAAVVGLALIGPLKAGAMPAQGAEPPAGNDSSAVARVVERFTTALGSGDSTTAPSLLADVATDIPPGELLDQRAPTMTRWQPVGYKGFGRRR